MVGGDGNSAKLIPPRDGYFEIARPTALFAGNAKAIQVSWIGFHGNCRSYDELVR